MSCDCIDYYCQPITKNYINENEAHYKKIHNMTILISILSYVVLINMIVTLWLIRKVRNEINRESEILVVELNQVEERVNEEEHTTDPVVHSDLSEDGKED